MEAPQNRRFYVKMECLPPLAHLYIEVRRGGLWAKHRGLKRGAIGNTLGEHIGNLKNILKTRWEPIGNLKGEHVGNKGKMKITPL